MKLFLNAGTAANIVSNLYFHVCNKQRYLFVLEKIIIMKQSINYSATKYFVPVVLLLSVLSADAQKIFYDPDARVINVGNFHGVAISGAIEVQLSQGENAVAVGAARPDAVKAEVKNGILALSVQGGHILRNRGRMRVYISARSLDKIEGSGASEINVNGSMKVNELAIHMSGASDFKGEIEAEALDVRLNGASDMKIKGSANDLKVEASGASTFKGYDFVAANSSINASGASTVKLTSGKLLNAEASGASSISYKGPGQPGKIKSSGASSITRKDN